MHYTLEKLEDQAIKLTVSVPAAEVEQTAQSVYESTKERYAVPGFRKGKVPRGVLEKMYGSMLFYEDAVNRLVPGAYQDAVKAAGLQVVSDPQIEYVDTDPARDLVFTAVVSVKPDIVLGAYKGVEIPQVSIAPVTEEEIASAIAQAQRQHATTVPVTNRPARLGDIALIDYDGFLDGAPFQGGKGTNHRLELGSGSFIPGFEEQVVGRRPGESFSISVIFPQTYHAPHLQGKNVIFRIMLHGLEAVSLPELSDTYARDIHHCTDFAAYRAQVARELVEAHRSAAREEKLDRALTRIVQSSHIPITQPMIDYQANRMIRELSANLLRQQGITLPTYLESTGQTEEAFRSSAEAEARRRLEIRWLMEAIVNAENTVFTEEEIRAEYDRLATPYHMTGEAFKSYVPEKEVLANLSRARALDLIVSTVIEVPLQENL